MREALTHTESSAPKKVPRPYSTSRAPSGLQRLVSIQQVVIEYGLPVGSIRDLVFKGSLRRVALGDGRRWWFDRRDLEALVEASKVTGTK